jgi:uncharacterized membrane protein
MPESRIEAFSDCVIGFAITLLIFDIHPQDAGTNIDNAGMIHAMLALAPRFSIYVISFLICTVAWVSHHELIHELDYVDPRLLWLNNLYLMWIAFLPFPTELIGNHPTQPVAAALYGAVCAITCLSFSLMRCYASFRGLINAACGCRPLRGGLRHYTCLSFSVMRWYASFRGLIKNGTDETKLRRNLRLSLCFSLLYLAGMTAGLLFPLLGLFLYAAIPAAYTISRLANHKGNVPAR